LAQATPPSELLANFSTSMTLARCIQLWAFGLCALTLLCLCGFLTRPAQVLQGGRRLGTTHAIGAAASISNLTAAGGVAGDSAPRCGLVEEDVDYGGGDLRALLSVESAAECAGLALQILPASPTLS